MRKQRPEKQCDFPTETFSEWVVPQTQAFWLQSTKVCIESVTEIQRQEQVLRPIRDFSEEMRIKLGFERTGGIDQWARSGRAFQRKDMAISILQPIQDMVPSKSQMWAKLENCFVLLRFFLKNKNDCFCFSNTNLLSSYSHPHTSPKKTLKQII